MSREGQAQFWIARIDADTGERGCILYSDELTEEELGALPDDERARAMAEYERYGERMFADPHETAGEREPQAAE